MIDLEIVRPFRRFKMGSLELPDPAPDLPPEEAVKLLAVNFPHLAAGLLGAPERRGETLVYPIEKPPVKTNG
ncbi:MAG TPA: PRTRC system protein C [Candidatus Paceibacterota bacterium]|nr:PRTRC system protein C [Candidatus Paceibacterota bacterium]